MTQGWLMAVGLGELEHFYDMEVVKCYVENIAPSTGVLIRWCLTPLMRLVWSRIDVG